LTLKVLNNAWPDWALGATTPLGSKDEMLFHQSLHMNFYALVFGNAISNTGPIAVFQYDGVLVLESDFGNGSIG
jgi:hypothetical protein